MAYHLDIKPLATKEALKAYDYYEDEKVGLGEEFFTELNKFYETLLLIIKNRFARAKFTDSLLL